MRSPLIHVERNISRPLFASILGAADVLVGNSSAGILEAPSFELPAVNLGRRQEGRLQAANVINAAHRKEEIQQALQKALSPEFRNSLSGMKNPYGDGCASERIIKILKQTPIDECLLVKRMTY
jgi:UDP-N-acetylglucosamine 2-epimerase